MLNVAAHEALRRAGLSVTPAELPALASDVDPEHRPDLLIDVAAPSHRLRFAVEVRSAAPYPAQVQRLDVVRDRLRRWGIPLLNAPYITEGQGRALTERGWSWIDDLGDLDLRGEGLVVRNRESRNRGHGRRVSKALPAGAVGMRVVRRLIVDPPSPLRTSTLAASVGTSAPRTSQVLHGLLQHGYVSTMPGGGWEVDRETLLQVFLEEYPGAGGDRRSFYALSLGEATAMVAGRDDLGAVISGDVAADLLAPHRRPSFLIAYVRGGWIDEGDTLVAATEAEANVVVIRPRDDSIFPVDAFLPSLDQRAVPLADPTQIAWDLQSLGGQDRLEHLEELKAWILRSP